jgi:hypothetical protein
MPLPPRRTGAPCPSLSRCRHQTRHPRHSRCRRHGPPTLQQQQQQQQQMMCCSLRSGICR